MTYISSQAIESQFRDCVRQICKVDTCGLRLDGFPGDRVILDVDCIIRSTDSGRKCDRVVVVDDTAGEVFFLPIEFKSGNLNTNRIKEQLESTVRFFMEHLPNQFSLYPIIVSTKLGSHERKSLSVIKINYGSSSKRIRHVRCNDYLKWNQVKRGIF